jgi:hypothetical protein
MHLLSSTGTLQKKKPLAQPTVMGGVIFLLFDWTSIFRFQTPPKTMATQQLRSYKFTTVRKLNYVKPGNGWTVDSVLTVEDLTLTNMQIMSWFNMRVWGNPDPAPGHNHLPLIRSNLILTWKKQISFFMPNRMQPWDHIGNSGNPTRCNGMASLLKTVKRMEARGIGKPSEARDSISETQFRLMNQALLDKDASIFEKYGIPALTKFQFHMISRIDDSTLFLRII